MLNSIIRFIVSRIFYLRVLCQLFSNKDNKDPIMQILINPRFISRMQIRRKIKGQERVDKRQLVWIKHDLR